MRQEGVIWADLHIHTTLSDGSEEPQDIIRQAREKGLSLIALTDHDTLEGVRYAGQYGPLRVLAGVEVSAIDRQSGRKAHILGYAIRDGRALQALCRPLLEQRHQNVLRMAQILSEQGYHIDTLRLHRAAGRYLYKQFLLEQLVQTGQAPELFGDFYRRVFGRGGVCHLVNPYIEAAQAVRAIRAGGGLAVLAHPGQQHNLDLVPSLVREGLCGLEREHFSNSEADRAQIDRLAARYGLFVTGGSDFHGRYAARASEIGSNRCPPSGVQAVLAAVQRG